MRYADPHSVIPNNKLLVWVAQQLSDPSALVCKTWGKVLPDLFATWCPRCQNRLYISFLVAPTGSSIIAQDVEYLMDYVPLPNWYPSINPAPNGHFANVKAADLFPCIIDLFQWTLAKWSSSFYQGFRETQHRRLELLIARNDEYHRFGPSTILSCLYIVH